MKKLQFLFFTLFTSTLFANPMMRQMPTPHVDVYKVTPQKSIKINDLTYPAETKAYRYATVVAKVNGTLQTIFIKEGSKVKKGETLFKIDDSIYKATLLETKANLKMAEATLYKAKKDWLRTKRLFERHATSVQTNDIAFSAYKVALAQVEMAKATLNKAQINFNYTNVKSPIDGITSIKRVDVGNYVTVGTPLIDVYNIDKIYVYFSLPKSQFEKLNKEYYIDGKLKVDIFKNNKKVGSAEVDYVDKKFDKDTSTVQLRAILNNKNHKVFPGDFVKVKLANVYEKNVILIPQKALLQSQKGSIVFVAENGKVAVRPIFSFSEYKDKYIVKGLLKPNDEVIINNFFHIKPGAKIIVDKVIGE